MDLHCQSCVRGEGGSCRTRISLLPFSRGGGSGRLQYPSPLSPGPDRRRLVRPDPEWRARSILNSLSQSNSSHCDVNGDLLFLPVRPFRSRRAPRVPPSTTPDGLHAPPVSEVDGPLLVEGYGVDHEIKEPVQVVKAQEVKEKIKGTSCSSGTVVAPSACDGLVPGGVVGVDRGRASSGSGPSARRRTTACDRVTGWDTAGPPRNRPWGRL